MFADTGGEFPETYEFVSAFSAWLVANGMPEVLTVRSTGKTLEEDCIDRHTLPSVAFGFKTCSQRWKTQPQDKYLNKWEPAREAWRMGGKVVKLIGYDADESHRIKDYDSQKYVVAYPLVSWGGAGSDARKPWHRQAFVPLNPRATSVQTPARMKCWHSPSHTLS
jgi:hypothetical protein